MKRLLLKTGLALTGLIYFLPIYSVPAIAAEFDQQSTQTFGDYTVHYTVFNSTFILPEIANTYQLTRAKNQSLINISVHNKAGTAVAATLNGYAQNLMQQQLIVHMEF